MPQRKSGLGQMLSGFFSSRAVFAFVCLSARVCDVRVAVVEIRNQKSGTEQQAVVVIICRLLFGSDISALKPNLDNIILYNDPSFTSTRFAIRTAVYKNYDSWINLAGLGER